MIKRRRFKSYICSICTDLITASYTNLACMSHEQIQLIVEFSIEQGKTEQFNQYINEMTKSVELDEPGALRYQWYMGQENTCIVTENYANSNAVLAHFKGRGVQTILVPKILSVAKITRFEVFGNQSKELLAALTKFNSRNYGYLTGFSRA